MIVTTSKGRKSDLVRVIVILIAVQARVPFIRLKQLRIDLSGSSEAPYLGSTIFRFRPSHTWL
jgi:hypothetical protein